MQDCPRCKIEMRMIDFQKEVVLPTGKVLPRLVYRCPCCMLDVSSFFKDIN